MRDGKKRPEGCQDFGSATVTWIIQTWMEPVLQPMCSQEKALKSQERLFQKDGGLKELDCGFHVCQSPASSQWGSFHGAGILLEWLLV